MTAAVASIPTTRERKWWDTPERRAEAARKGWQRRRGTYVLTTAERLHLAVEAVDPRVLRRYCCDLAEACQQPYLDCFPGGTFVRDIVGVARRYASGEATEAEREKATRQMRRWFRALEAQGIDLHDTAMCAVQAACFCILKSNWHMVWALYWAHGASHPGLQRWSIFTEENVAVLEALARK